jgi:hypothetical protein
MTPCFPATLARLSSPACRKVALSLIAGGLTLASAGCFHFGVKPISANPPTQQQLEAYAEQQTAIRSEVSGRPEEHCDELAAAAPGVEEIRTNHGSIESRQWTLVANGAERRWVFVRVGDSSPEGWAPKPGIDKLNFQPPLEPALAARPSVFLAYAPVESQTLADSGKFASARDAFGPPQGAFTWHGRKYSYTLAPELPCFPRLP